MRIFSLSWPGIFAAWKRHARLHFRALFTRVLFPITEPIVYLVGFGFGLGALVGPMQVGKTTVSYLEFVAPGMVAVSVLFQPYIEAGYGSFIRFRFGKVWQSFLTAPLAFEDVFAAELLWSATKGVLGGYTTALVALWFGALSWWGLVQLFPIIVLGSFMNAALGLAAGSLCRQIDDMNVTLFLLVVPMFTFAGAYYPRSALPAPFADLAGFLPFAPIVDLMRNTVVGGLSVDWFLVLVALLWTVLFTSVAYRCFHKKVFP